MAERPEVDLTLRPLILLKACNGCEVEKSLAKADTPFFICPKLKHGVIQT